MNLLPHWVLTDKFPAFYDSESKTAIEQTARVYGAMQELIKEYNSFVDSVNQHILDFENAAKKDYEIFTTAIRQEFQDFIDVVTLKIQSQDSIIEDAVSYMKTNLSESIDAALLEMRASGGFSQEVLKVYADMENQIAALNSRMNTFTTLEEGSTTGDAELQDGRTDYTGKTWDNIGSHIRGVTSELSGEIVEIDNIVTKENTKYISGWLQGVIYNGNFNQSNLGISHDYISMKKGTVITVPSGYTFHVAKYDENKAYIGQDRNLSGSYKLDDNYKIIVTVRNADGSELLVSNAPTVSYSLKVDNVMKKTEVYTVGATGDFLSFTKCIRALKDNTNEKIIYIQSGYYDIFNEIGGSSFALNIESETDWKNVSDIVPPNTHIIGLGFVVFNFLPTVDEIGYQASQLLSPLNIAGSCTVENIIINAKNCRYCIHDETGNNEVYFGSVKNYKNVKCYKLDADTKDNNVYGKAHAYACGFSEDMVFNFENCYFEGEWSAFYMHNSDFHYNHSGLINIDKSIFKARKSTSDGSALSLISFTPQLQNVRTNICNSYFTSNIKLASGSDANVNNAFNVTLLHCNDIEVVVGEMKNELTPTIYK